MTPELIRELRGGASRAAFARQLGVTPHTVYRWELPLGAAQARRPRGTQLSKLQALAEGESISAALGPVPAGPACGAPVPVAPSGSAPAERQRLPAAEDLSLVLPALQRAFSSAGQRGHAELVQLSVKRPSLSLDSLALARFGVAVIELLQRSDPRAALLVIAPALQQADAGELSEEVQGRVFAAAAVLHALPDASLFDLGRVHAHAARAEALSLQTGPEAACLACLAQLCAATVVGDRELLDRAYAKLQDAAFFNLPPLLELHVEEFKALRPVFSGMVTVSLRRFEALAERAEQLGCPVLLARVLGHIALAMLENLGDPSRALEVAQRSLRIGKGSRIAPGIHSVFALRAELEALTRLGRMPEAFATLAELDGWTAETGIVPLSAIPFQTRLLFLAGRDDQLSSLSARLRQCEVSSLRPISRAYAAMTEATACITSAQDVLATVAAFERAEAQAERWPLLLRYVLMFRVVAHVIAGQDGPARLALRRAQRYVDMFPSAWVSAHLRRLEGILLSAQGQWSAGRQLLESAIATFELAHDVCDAALCRHVVAVFAEEYGDGDRAAVDATREALRQIDVVPPRSLGVGIERLRESRRLLARSWGEEQRLLVEDLVVPLRRLSARGVGALLLLRELCSIVSSLFPDRRLRLEEIDSRGSACGLAGFGDAEAYQVGGSADAGYDWVEFSDGSGRLLRIGLQGELSEHQRSSLSVLVMATSLALEAATLRGVTDPFEATVHEDRLPELPGFIAASPVMRKLRAELVRLASSRATVIISGESGSGKEVIARAIHTLSQRAQGSYIPFNCTSVPRELFEGQLFGYRRGAFTGASSDHPGVIRAADGGTLFLDEIAELPLDLQPKLLRFLENAEVFPLGGQRPVKVDVRVLAASHRDLMELVREGRFREDLYYRLQVVPIHVPPLRERREDIPVLARHFVRQLTSTGEPPVLGPDALSALLAHPWRGNVRELRNVIERALAFSPAPDVLQARHLHLAA
ncbi:MAG: sigma-54 dependent transcriptional regulator [Deltaproteobacteria bacterium]